MTALSLSDSSLKLSGSLSLVRTKRRISDVKPRLSIGGEEEEDEDDGTTGTRIIIINHCCLLREQLISSWLLERMAEAAVNLIIKAPNQQIKDQIVRCDLGWTIGRLKEYLSEVYPSKPVSHAKVISESNRK